MSFVGCCFRGGESVWIDDVDVTVPRVGGDGEAWVLASAGVCYAAGVVAGFCAEGS